MERVNTMKTLLWAAVELSTILHELEANKVQLTRMQENRWSEATEIIETERGNPMFRKSPDSDKKT